MKRMSFLLGLAFILSFASSRATNLLPQGGGRATNDMIAFYQKAETAAQHPPPETSLRIVCQETQDQGYVSFIGTPDASVARIILAAYTQNKLERPQETIRLQPTKSGNSPLVAAGDVLDWGYVFDRNADGLIDYFAFLVGALAVKPQDFQGALPQGGARIGADQIGLFNRHARLVFIHAADDDFDGKVDGVVHPVVEQIWVERWVAARSTRRDGELDDAWFFTADISARAGVPGRSGGGWAIPSRSVINGVLDGHDLASWSEYIARLNRAAKVCGLGHGDFPVTSGPSQQAGDRVWINPAKGWSISYPEGWTVDSRDLAFVKLQPPPGLAWGQVGIHSAMLGTQFRSADELADAALAAENQAAGPVRVVSRRNVVLADGTPAVEVVNVLGGDAKGKARKVFILANGDGFIIDAETFIDAWQELESHFDRIINSFVLRH